MIEENHLLKEFKNKYATKAAIIIFLIFSFSLAGIIGTFAMYHQQKNNNEMVSISGRQTFISALIMLDLKTHMTEHESREAIKSLNQNRKLFKKGLHTLKIEDSTVISGVKNSIFATDKTEDQIDIYKESLAFYAETNPDLVDHEERIANIKKKLRDTIGAAWNTHTKQRALKNDHTYFMLVLFIVLCFGAVLSLIIYAHMTIIRPLMKEINRTLNKNEKIAQENKENKMLLKYSSKFVSLGENIANINHDMNNIVSVMSTFIRSFKRHLKDQPELLNRFAMMEKSVERLSALTAALRRSIVVSESITEESFKLIDIVNDCQIILSDKLKKENVRLELDIDQNLLVTMRRDYLYQLILNLVSNSIEALSEIEDAWVKIDAFDKNGELFIRVTDAGFGLSTEVQEKLFTPFFTTKKSGSGLGLNYAKKMIETVGGQLYYEEKVMNTCFTLKIPQKNTSSLQRVA